MKIFVAMIVFICSLFASSYPQDIYENVIIKDAKNLVVSGKEFLSSLESDQNIKESFERLMIDWKRVQALFIASGIDESLLDLPFEIDTYHHGKENIKESLDRIIASQGDIRIDMFKSAYKTINAIEYLIFKDSTDRKRELEMAYVATESLIPKLQQIVDIYEKNRESILKDEKKFNALLLNRLIDSTYELKEWRIGEPNGLVKKYQNKPDAKRSEYFHSNLSVKAITAILEAYLSVIDNSELLDFGDKSIGYGAKDDIGLIRSTLRSSINSAKNLNNEIVNPYAKRLYTDISKLHNGFYISLISTLKMTSKILDADGD